MTPPDAPAPVRARYFNAGFLTDRRIRRILHLSGIDLSLGRAGPDAPVVVWGDAGTAHRGLAVAARTSAPVIRVEDAFLRSLHPGRAGEATLGLTIDHAGAWFDARSPSDLERMLARDPFDDGALVARAHAAMARMRAAHITKYAAVDIAAQPPAPGYVLVIDQTRGDASVRLGGATAATFREMLVMAQEEHPHTRIVIKTHPETTRGLREGYFGPQDTTRNITLETRPLSPYAMMEGAVAVYTVTSQMGFEAIIAGHRPVVFGQPFYAGWGLSDDRAPIDRRTRTLTRAQLFAGVMMRYPKWYDPYRDRLCQLEDVLDTLEARARAWREDAGGYIATGMRLWKRRPLQQMLGRERRIMFRSTVTAPDRPVLAWAGKVTPALRRTCAAANQPLIRVEDGFLRSRGLGADLVPPLSLVLDPDGIYYDPTAPSRLEHCITQAATMGATAQVRAERLIAQIRKAGLTKYNLDRHTPLPTPPQGASVLLVPGQVADDASVRLGAGQITDNAGLLDAARRAHPDAWIIYKPHPDVEAGLRTGAIDASQADWIARDTDPLALIALADRVWTLTSGLGFEALIRDVPVTTLGAPFYAGWGLTQDLGRVPARRGARPTLAQLVHGVLIAYPRYFDPVTRTPCPPEVIVNRLAHGPLPRPHPANRALAKLQGAFASVPWMWR
jgi:capsular polysaccharide export protein